MKKSSCLGQRWYYVSCHRAVFEQLLKTQHQSQQKQTVQWTNQNFKQFPVTCSNPRKHHVHKLWLALVLPIIVSQTAGMRFFNPLLSIAITVLKHPITFDYCTVYSIIFQKEEELIVLPFFVLCIQFLAFLLLYPSLVHWFYQCDGSLLFSLALWGPMAARLPQLF